MAVSAEAFLASLYDLRLKHRKKFVQTGLNLKGLPRQLLFCFNDLTLMNFIFMGTDA